MRRIKTLEDGLLYVLCLALVYVGLCWMTYALNLRNFH